MGTPLQDAKAHLERTDLQSSNAGEVLDVARREAQAVFERSGRDERIGKAQAELTGHSARTFCHVAIDRKLPERGEQLHDGVGSSAPGEQLRSRHDRVVQPVTTRLQLHRASQVVDEDVGVDE